MVRTQNAQIKIKCFRPPLYKNKGRQVNHFVPCAIHRRLVSAQCLADNNDNVPPDQNTSNAVQRIAFPREKKQNKARDLSRTGSSAVCHLYHHCRIS